MDTDADIDTDTDPDTDTDTFATDTDTDTDILTVVLFLIRILMRILKAVRWASARAFCRARSHIPEPAGGSRIVLHLAERDRRDPELIGTTDNRWLVYRPLCFGSSGAVTLPACIV